MDAVITYVNGLDPHWQKEYASVVGGETLRKRYRDWGTLPYLVRGIRAHMPYVNNVYLVVSGESQVPEWVRGSDIKVVLHKDIIPAEFLPTFNSNTIELFLHRIPGLDQEFLSFNDDMFPVRDTKAEEFFQDGKPVTGFTRNLVAGNLFKVMTRNTDRKVREALGLPRSPFFIRPQHTVYPMLRSACEEVSSVMARQIRESVSPVREEYNLIHYLFLDYLFYKGQAVNRRHSNKHFSLAAVSATRIAAFLASPTADFVCINDVQMSEDRFVKTRDILLDSFEKLLPSGRL